MTVGEWVKLRNVIVERDRIDDGRLYIRFPSQLRHQSAPAYTAARIHLHTTHRTTAHAQPRSQRRPSLR